MSHKWPRGLVLAAALLSVCSLPAQVLTGSLSGEIGDTSGAVVPRVPVSAVHAQTGRIFQTTSTETGSYVLTGLPTGTYEVTVAADGFKRAVKPGVALELNQNARLDFRLEVGQTSEQVTVQAEASLVDTRQSQMGGTVDERRVNTLPLNGRNVYDLVRILPGVASLRTTETLDSGGTQMVVNGNRARSNTFLLDGAFNNDTWRNQGNSAPNPDAVEQFRLITNNFSAEFGRAPGAVVNVITKSGSNNLHGSLFHFLRNSSLNARNFFQPSVNPIRQNQFGASVGGPVIRNRTFFFASWQSLRIAAEAFINTGLTPTVAERAGDFSSAPAAQRPVDPLTNTAFPDSRIPVNRFDPVAVNMLKLVALPNTPDGRVQITDSRKTNEDQWLGKMDHQFNQAHRLSTSFFLMRNSSLDPFNSGTQVPGWASLTTALKQYNGVATHDWILSPSSINQLLFSSTLVTSEAITGATQTWKDFGSQVGQGTTPGRPPQITVTGRWQMGHAGGGPSARRSFGLQDTHSINRGNHSIKLGGWWLAHIYAENSQWLGSGQVTFNGSFSRNAVGDLLLGRASSFRQNNGTDFQSQAQNLHWFVQDDWKISRRLTLNLGLRHEITGRFYEKDDRMSSMRFGQQSTVIPLAPIGLVYPGDPGVERSTLPGDYNDVGPRVGMAWDVFGTGKTAVRAGYGVFFTPTFSNQFTISQPFILDVTVFGTPNLVTPYQAIAGGNPFPYTVDRKNPRFVIPSNSQMVAPPFRTAYVQHYSFTIEQQLMHNLALNVAFVGNTSRKLLVARDANAPLLTASATAANVNARRPYRPDLFSSITERASSGNANYNSLQATINRRFSNSFSILGSYTWSKAIDEQSDDVGGSGALTDNYNRRLERGPAAFDLRHIASASWVWDLPRWNRAGWVGRELIGHWELTGIARFESGAAFSVLSGRDTNLDGVTNERADYVSGDPMLPSGRTRDEMLAKYFNTAAFGVPANGRVGNLGRNTLYGPGAATWNVSAVKLFTIREPLKLQFRSEFFNAFNRANFANPNSTLTNANAGRILSAGAGRVIQFAMRLTF